MITWIKKLFLCLLLISCQFFCLAQEVWPSPELEQMYRNVKAYEKLGNNKDAIITLKQLINLAPERKYLKTELGNLYYLSGDYKTGEATLQPLIAEPAASDTEYQLLAACQIALGEKKQAKNTMKKGIQLFPHSGMLYYRNGLLLLQQHDTDAAINLWTKGVTSCPLEPLNYGAKGNYSIGTTYNTEGIIYTEMYLAMKSDTAGNDTLKSALFKGWKLFFKELADDKDMDSLYRLLTPVVSDGITTENLTMVRTRFLIEWTKQSNVGFPNALFIYQDDLIRNGWFDIYNEWLFGKAEHAGQYAAWNKFHAGDIEKFETWRASHLLKPGIKN